MNVEQQIRDLQDRIKALESQDLNLRGRRVTNSGRALLGSDLITLGQARDLIASPETSRVLEQRIETVGGGPFGIPLSLGDTNQQGSSSLYADAQHVHASGLTTKGDLLGYSTATTRVAVSATNGESLYSLSTATPGVAYGSGWKGAKTKSLTPDSTTNVFEVALPTVTVCGGTIAYLAQIQDASTIESEAGTISYIASNHGGSYDFSLTTPDMVQSGSLLTVEWDIVSGTNKITVRVGITSGSIMSPTAASVRYFLFTPDAQVVTFL